MDKGEQIWESLADKEYREEIAIEYLNINLAVQIMRMREKRQLSQSELANLLGQPLEVVVQWEDPDYEWPSLINLEALAKAFDVALLVKFIPFSELVGDMVSMSRLSPASFSGDQYFTGKEV